MTDVIGLALVDLLPDLLTVSSIALGIGVAVWGLRVAWRVTQEYLNG
jgi:hypothetical protein